MSTSHQGKIDGSRSPNQIAVIWPFLLVIAVQMLFAGFSMNALSAIRSCLMGERLGIQAQLEAITSLKSYIISAKDEQFRSYEAAIGPTRAFHEARVALLAPVPDLDAAKAAFIRSGMPTADVTSILWLDRYLRRFSYVARANEHWTLYDTLFARLDSLAGQIRAQTIAGTSKSPAAWTAEVEALEPGLSASEAAFARSLDDGAVVIERLLMIVNLGLALGLGALTVWRVQRFLKQRRAIETELGWQASHDALTGVANRRAFERRLDRMTAGAVRRAPYALLFVDLDQFKIVNDTCGHAAGDDLLRRVCAMLQEHLQPDDLLARLGGDEFSILLTDCRLDRAVRTAEVVRAAAETFDFLWDKRAFRISASIGLVHTEVGPVTTEDLMRTADMACFLAKQKGRNRVHLHRADDQDLMRYAGEMSWVQRIHQALDDNRFCLYAQEIAPLGSQCEYGLHVELLIRMHDETGGLVPPAAFLPAAERFGLMNLIDRWVVRVAFRILADRRADPEAEPIACCAINLSGVTVGDEAFFDFLKASFAEFAIPPSIVCFEITETSAITNLDAATSFVLALQAMGCRFSLDDFGSGMSSFGYLKHLPVDFLKIDGGFVRNLLNDQVDRAMVEAINHIGHVMGSASSRNSSRPTD